MKIGLLTFHDTNNYGAMLQAFSLQKKIIELGHDCEIIDYVCENIKKRECPPRILEDGIVRAPITFIFANMKKKKYNFISEFRRNNCIISNNKYSKETVRELNNCYDIFLSGSDMIWELNVTGGDTTYLLDFVEDNKKKRAYSSSFGHSQISMNHVGIYQKLLSQYFRISVRENGGQKIVESLISRKVPVTLDPTLLYDKNFWARYEEPIKLSNKYVFVYFDDNEHTVINSAIVYAKRNNMKVVYLSDSLREISGVKSLRTVSVGQFLWLVSNSECVFTASYHGVAFSVNYNRPFYYYNRAHSDRINTLINNLGLANREIGNEIRNESINWEIVNELLEQKRVESIEYLKDSITLEE